MQAWGSEYQRRVEQVNTMLGSTRMDNQHIAVRRKYEAIRDYYQGELQRIRGSANRPMQATALRALQHENE